MQLSGSSAGVEGSTSSESSPQTNAESLLNCNHMRRLKIQGPLFTLWLSPTADKKTTKNEMTCFSWLVYSDSVDLFIVTALGFFFATKLNETHDRDRQMVCAGSCGF